MNGIISPEALAQSQNGSHTASFIEPPESDNLEAALAQEFSKQGVLWTAPQSWSVVPLASDQAEPSDDEDCGYPHEKVVQKEKPSPSTEQLCIRVFREDSTFGTVTVPVQITTAELCSILARKFFLSDASKYNLYMKRNGLVRILGPQERPIYHFKRLLEQIGYTSEDQLKDQGREDNTYLCRFTFGLAGIQSINLEKESELGSFRHVDLQARNLQTIPILLYRHTTTIQTLDISKNLMLDLPLDFVQLCSNLREINLSGNGYKYVPSSVRHTPKLLRLDLSNNRLKEIESAQLHYARELTDLNFCNNRINTIPREFVDLTTLACLNLSNNKFTEFPSVNQQDPFYP
ncbi:cysteinyl-tRNA synthetase [Basidiobolus ranarum]|uniref:Cysteinyl-tRNA synthetase n=1 Tax=Basidiobolus ranarum TaxID=34480 RepID=A0ABR2VQF0_9FUNG